MERKILLFCLFISITFIGRCDNLSYVNMFMGCKGDNGQTTPAACVPFGLASVCPDTNPQQHGGYDYGCTRVLGISLTRISGTGCSGVGGNLRILPGEKGESVEIIRSSEKATPGYYESAFSNGSKCMLTATYDMAVEKFILSKSRTLYVNFGTSIDPRPVECEYQMIDDRHINGYFKSPTVCARGQYKLYFNLSCDKAFELEEISGSEASLHFRDSKVEVRVSLSAIDLTTAENITAKWAPFSFKNLKDNAAGQWRDKLNRISVKGGTEEQKILFYTSLMRVYHSPMVATSDNRLFLGTDGYIHKADSFTYYGGWSLWDTFRAKFPMLVLLEPDEMRNICESLIELYKNGKKNWATPYESTPTVRTEHAGILLLDAYRKGVRNISLRRGYEGMKLEEAIDLPMKTPDQKLESAYDIWALAQIAEIIGEDNDAAKYSSKADSLFISVWTREFMNVDESYFIMRNNGLYQGSRYMYRWMAPQYLDKMIELRGQKTLHDELAFFFDNYLFNQGNEPDIHTPFIFNRLGDPEKTRQVVHGYLVKEDMKHIYGGNAEYPEPFIGRAFQNKLEGYAPEMDEDDGTMSAWYLFCQMGFYPLVIGEDSYELFSPYFDEIVIEPREGYGKVTIRTVGRKSYDEKVREIYLNGRKVFDWRISNEFFRKGGLLEFRY